MAIGQFFQTIPRIESKDIDDVVVRQNFQNLSDFFSQQNQFINFNFFEVVFTKAIDNFKIAHNLTKAPLDIILAQLTGTGVVSFNLGLSDKTFLNISSTGPARVRFFAGTYWNYISNVQTQTTDVMVFNPSGNSQIQTSKVQKIISQATYQATTNDGLLLADCSKSAITILLPPTSDDDQSNIRVQKIDSSANACTVQVGNKGFEFIRSAQSLKLATQWDAGTFYCVKPVWYY